MFIIYSYWIYINIYYIFWHFKTILNLIKEIKNEKFANILLDILSGLFLEEYKSIYFRKVKNKELEDLYINREMELTKIYLDTINSYQKEVYDKIERTM